MATEVIKAIILSQKENNLIDTIRKIKMHEGVLNSIKTSRKQKKESKRKLIGLMKYKNSLVDEITESALLDA